MRRSRSPSLRVAKWIALVSLCLAAAPAAADVFLDQARRMHDRLVGVPPDPTVLQSMRSDIALGTPEGAVAAAETAMQQPGFINIVLKNWVKPWSNVEQTVFVPLNDYVATVIGNIRDDGDFRDVISADVVYVANTTNLANDGYTIPAYSHFNNDSYAELEANQVDLSRVDYLEPTPQSGLPGSQIGAGDAAGVITTRAAGEAFFIDGTNRRMFRFTAMNYLCRDMEQLHDVTRPADKVRQDISRSPGGDSQLFHQQCIGCHSGMDPMSGAYAYFEWDKDQNRVVHSPGFVTPKHLINANTFPGGYITVDNRWQNMWRDGVNAVLGWNGPSASGFGPQSLGVEIANSRAFSLCQVEKVFEEVCFRPPESAGDAQAIKDIADAFELSSYRMKTAFAQVAAYCMGD